MNTTHEVRTLPYQAYVGRRNTSCNWGLPERIPAVFNCTSTQLQKSWKLNRFALSVICVPSTEFTPVRSFTDLDIQNNSLTVNLSEDEDWTTIKRPLDGYNSEAETGHSLA
jgi:hypothetical protein